MDCLYQYTCPGKVFILGEYLALKGGPVVGLGVEPRFQLLVQGVKNHLQGSPQLVHFPQGSPAQLFFQKNFELFQNHFSNCQIVFHDPYEGAGGFGASSAQFLLLYELLKESGLHTNGLFPENNLKNLLKEFSEVANLPRALFQPSGADVIGQKLGGFFMWNKSHGHHEILTWNFPDLEFLIFHTGKKVATHTHLAELNDFNDLPLEQTLQHALSAIKNGQEELFLNSLKQWQHLMLENKWVCVETQEKLKELNVIPEILFAKGCGALGADLIFVLTRKKDLQIVMKKIKPKIFCTRDQLSVGLEWKRN